MSSKELKICSNLQITTVRSSNICPRNSPTKKPTKKQDSIVKLEKTNQEEKEIIKETNIEEKATQEKKSITIGYVIKIIFLVITSPIWLPWRLLFVRRKGRKFNEVNTVTKVFRILRSPITKPLKFALFIFILVVEISLINKITGAVKFKV